MIRVEASLRYGVVGIYRDREVAVWRVYPIPFVRLTIELKRGA